MVSSIKKTHAFAAPFFTKHGTIADTHIHAHILTPMNEPHTSYPYEHRQDIDPAQHLEIDELTTCAL